MGKVIYRTDIEQRSPEWKALKIGKVSGSQIVGLTSKARMETYLFNKLSEMILNALPEVHVTEPMKRGTELEPVARELYEDLTGNDVTEVGIVENTDYPLGLLSPDGLIGKEGALEIKCPNTATHLKTIAYSAIPKHNLAQVTWYFIILEDIQWLDFFSYDDRAVGSEYFLTRITREELSKEIDAMKKAYKEYEKQFNEILAWLKT